MRILIAGVLVLAAGCSSDNVTVPRTGTSPTALDAPLKVLGMGSETARYTAEIAVKGSTAYTTTWGSRPTLGNKVDIWDVSGATPILTDSLIVAGASTLGDVQVSDDSTLLMVATERTGGAIVLYDISNPRKPVQVARYSTANTNPGVHTAKFGRVNGKLYGFLSIDPLNLTPARLVIVDLSDPANPREIFTRVIGNPYVHDTFIRDGILFLALWNDGLDIWDIGGGGQGGTPDNPKVLGNVRTVGGEVHNVWWFHDAQGGKRFAFVGEEGPGSIGSSSIGDIHVVDVSSFASPKEIGFYHVDGAGTHNFSIDEKNAVLYAAYYNGGVRAIDVHGDLSSCPGASNFNVQANITRCDLKAMGRELAVGLLEQNRGVYVWGVEWTGGNVYASDMVNGIWKMTPAK
ncbi:MAG TPA: hypothetical protein VN706_09960 [Gemmatimonadaceae bacterium]|nr:hypothetical protein [Gemmatimonadaceae bacterium]